MADEESALSKEQRPAPRNCWPFPIALYDYSGLLFELYQGGQPPREHEDILWSRIKPIIQEPRTEDARGEDS
jgi:hypothetical protein